MLADEQVLFLQPGAGVNIHADEEIIPWFSQLNLRKEKKVGSPWETLPSVTLVSCHWLFTDSLVLVVTNVKNWVLWGSLIILEHFLGAISLYIEDISILCVCVCSVIQSRLTLWPHGLQPTRLLWPWNLPGKHTWASCHFLLQGIFLTQGPNLYLLHPLHWHVDTLPLVPLGKASYKFLKFQSLYVNVKNKIWRAYWCRNFSFLSYREELLKNTNIKMSSLKKILCFYCRALISTKPLILPLMTCSSSNPRRVLE